MLVCGPETSKGFTLIELLVGMVIMGIILSVGSVSYRDFSRRRSIENAARELRSQIIKTREMALAGAKPSTGSCTGADLDSFRIAVTYISSGDVRMSYVVSAVCGGTLETVKASTIIDLPDYGSVSMSPLVYTADFGVPIASATITQQTLSIVGFGQTEEINISSTGEIN